MRKGHSLNNSPHLNYFESQITNTCGVFTCPEELIANPNPDQRSYQVLVKNTSHCLRAGRIQQRHPLPSPMDFKAIIVVFLKAAW